MAKFLSIENKSGRPVETKGGKLIVFSQAVQLRIPGMRGGLVWNRPVSLLATSADGHEQVIPIQDVTRTIVWTLAGAALATGLFFWLKSMDKKQEDS